MYVSFLFLIVQHVGIDAGLERRIKHEPVEKIISIACLAEPYVSPHQPEFLQVVADGPFTHRILPASSARLPVLSVRISLYIRLIRSM